jgi:tetratricopeptide (TPR) repeat protein
MGKTRLVAEFYARMAAEHRSKGRGYWPEQLPFRSVTIDVNPDVASIDDAFVAPFGWWGIRVVRGQTVGPPAVGVVASHVDHLLTHAHALEYAGRLQRVGMRMGVALAKAAASLLPLAGGIVEWATLGVDLADAFRRRTLKRSDTLVDEHERLARDRNERIEQLFAALLASDRGRTPAPFVWWIDDVDAAAADRDLIDLFDRVTEQAFRLRHPLLIVLTAWPAAWAEQPAAVGKTIPALALARALRANPQWRPTLLQPLSAGVLRPRLQEAIAGLTPPQTEALLRAAGGQLLHLEEIIAFVRGSARAWVNRHDLAAGLKSDAFGGLLTAASGRLEDLIRARLITSPTDVRTLVDFGTLQGMQVTPRLAERLHDRLHEGATDAVYHGTRFGPDTLDRATRVYGLLEPVIEQVLAAYPTPHHHAAAQHDLPDVADDESLRVVWLEVLEAELRAAVQEPAAPGADRAAWAHTLQVAIRDLASVERTLPLRADALLKLAAFALESGDPSAALEHAVAFAAWIEASPALLSGRDWHEVRVVTQHLSGQQRHREALLLAEWLQRTAARGMQEVIAAREVGRAHEGAGRPLEALGFFERALATFAAVEGDPGPARSRHILLNDVGRVQTALGDHDAARATLTASLEIARALSDADRDLAVTLNLVGDAQLRSGDPRAAFVSHTEALAISERLQAAQPRVDGVRDVIAALVRAADAQVAMNDATAAQDALSQAATLVEAWSERLTAPALAQDRLAVLTRSGAVLHRRGDAHGALATWVRATEAYLQLADSPAATRARKVLVFHLLTVGDEVWADDDVARAQVAYRSVLALSEASDDPALLRFASITLCRIAGLHASEGDLPTAVTLYERARHMGETLLQRLATPGSRDDLRFTLMRRAMALRLMGDDAGAEAVMERAATLD